MKGKREGVVKGSCSGPGPAGICALTEPAMQTPLVESALAPRPAALKEAIDQGPVLYVM